MTEPLTIDAILDTFAVIDGVLPRAAMEQAISRWPEVAPVLLAELNAAADGAGVSERSDNILLIGIYLMAQMRETRAYRPLCALIAVGERASDVLGDGVTEDLKFILARVYDGDPMPLRSVIEAEGADEFTRDAAFGALAWLTATGRIEQEETASYLRDLHTTLQPQAECYAWLGWLFAIANLGLEDLAPLVEDVFNRGWIDPMHLRFEDFRQDLAAARQAVDPITAFAERDDGSLDDVVGMMSTWSGFQPKKSIRPLPAPLANDGPIRNPYRDVGRNDPCPCGSGRKFKKCCLELVR